MRLKAKGKGQRTKDVQVYKKTCAHSAQHFSDSDAGYSFSALLFCPRRCNRRCDLSPFADGNSHAVRHGILMKANRFGSLIFGMISESSRFDCF